MPAFIASFGEWKVTLLDTETGEISPMPAKYEGGNTLVKWISGACSSLLLELEEGRGEFGEVSEESFSGETVLAGEAEISLSEPNVLLLDKPSYSLNGGEIKRERDILYTDMAVRDALGIRRRGSHMKQPWAEPLDKNPQDKLTLYYDFESDIEYEGAELALECLEYTDDIIFNGEKLKAFPLRSGTRMPTHATCIEHSFGSSCRMFGPRATRCCPISPGSSPALLRHLRFHGSGLP